MGPPARRAGVIWQTDAYALATGYEDRRYTGLWLPGDNERPPVATDSLLLVQPAVAVAQREQEVPDPSTDPDEDNDSESGGTRGGATAGGGSSPKRVAKTRYFGVKTLNPNGIAMDFKNISDEVLAHLKESDTTVTVRIEIEATNTGGFDDARIRTVSENARTLNFDQSDFDVS